MVISLKERIGYITKGKKVEHLMKVLADELLKKKKLQNTQTEKNDIVIGKVRVTPNNLNIFEN